MQLSAFRALLRGNPDDCWAWPHGYGGNGYGAVRIPELFGNRPVGVHRAAYTVIFGPIQPGRHLHHRCLHPWCFNPWHLRERTPKAHRSEHTRERCPNGHVYELPPGEKGKHRCLQCRRERHRETYRRRHGYGIPSNTCRRGHPWTDESTRWCPDGKRRCRICLNEAQRRRRAKD